MNKIKKSKFYEIIREEIKNTLLEISSYDQSLIPKERQLDDDEIKEILNEKNTISDVIKSVDYKKSHIKYYKDLLNSARLELINFILKYNLNTDANETQDYLEKLSIDDLDEFIAGLSPEATKEYNQIKYEFVSDLMDEEIINKDSFYGIE